MLIADIVQLFASGVVVGDIVRFGVGHGLYGAFLVDSRELRIVGAERAGHTGRDTCIHNIARPNIGRIGHYRERFLPASFASKRMSG